MTEKRSCLRCGRGIDGSARICPFCNWDQERAVPAADEAGLAPQLPTYTPPEERSVRKLVLFAVGGVLVLCASFAVGMLINRDGTPDKAPAPITETIGKTQHSSTPSNAVPLVPMGAVETPITSVAAPVADASVPNEYQRHDATAVSSVEYQQLAARADAERKKREQMAVMTDPRTLTGSAYAPDPRATPPRPKRATPAEHDLDQQGEQPVRRASTRVATRTRPVPRYTPVPSIHVDEAMVAKVDLIVGKNGEVREVFVRTPVPGQTSKLIAAIQSWKFEPATENGEPVTAQFSVDISFRGNE